MPDSARRTRPTFWKTYAEERKSHFLPLFRLYPWFFALFVIRSVFYAFSTSLIKRNSQKIWKNWLVGKHKNQYTAFKSKKWFMKFKNTKRRQRKVGALANKFAKKLQKNSSSSRTMGTISTAYLNNGTVKVIERLVLNAFTWGKSKTSKVSLVQFKGNFGR